MLVDMEKGTAMEPHQHPEEQLGFVFEGAVAFIVGPDRELHTVRSGSFFFFESNESHGVRVPEKTLILATFGPSRKDYLHLAIHMNK